MKQFKIMAIDPGASGGIAIYTHKGINAIAMPETDDDIRAVIEEFSLNSIREEITPVCYIELVSGFMGGAFNAGAHMFVFGDGFGYIRGLVDAFKIKRVMVRPQLWQKGIAGVNGEKTARKNALKEHAARTFPAIPRVTLKTADALCIADYAYKQEAITAPHEETRDASEAIQWARSNGWGIPKQGSPDWYSMIAFYKGAQGMRAI